ncbi:MAG: EAL domain-containing protein [Candidatus Acidulodesulfobacterium sp.]
MENTENFNFKNLDAGGFIEALLGSKSLGVFIYQKNCRIIHSNKTFREFIGYSEDELKSLAPYDIVADEYRAEVKKLNERRINGEFFAGEQINHMHVTKEGVFKPTMVFAYTVFYDGKPAGLVIVQDVSKQKMYDGLFRSFKSLQTMYATLSEVNQIIVRAKDENSLLSDISKKIINEGLFVDSFIVLFDSNLDINASFSNEKSDYLNYLKNHLSTPEAKKGPLITSFIKSKIVINNDTLKNTSVLPWKEEQTRRGFLSSAAVPVIKKGKTIGVLSFYANEREFFKRDTYNLLKEMMMDINYALDKIEDEKWHFMIRTALNSGSDFTIILDKYFKILFVNESVYKIFGYTAEELVGEHYSKIFEGGSGKKSIAERFLATIISGEILTDVFAYKTKNDGDIYCYTTIMPFSAGNFSNGSSRSSGADCVIEYYITTGKDITGEIKAEETIERLINFDPLTGFPNKKLLKEKIDEYIKETCYAGIPSHCALAILNPVNLSLINHTYGFETGSKILKEAGDKIKKIIKNFDILARWEADKFAVFLKRLKFDEDALHIINRVLAVLNEPYYMQDGEKKINISFNAGISVYSKDTGTAQAMFDQAESALLNAKSKGENSVSFFKKEFEESARKKVELKNSLSEAFEKNQFILHYQPYFDIKNGLIKGAEALLRWQKDDKLVPPMEFIPFMEQSGIITKVENWILEDVSLNIRKWSDEGLKVVPISVNISPVSFADPNLKDNMHAALNKNGIKPDLFNLEIVERTFINNLDYSSKLLGSLKEKGFGLSIDDFGTGYSSLSYLADLPFDILKIDISFVRKMLADKHSRYIVETIIYLSKKLNMQSIAEGVETIEQFNLLKELGCDYIQGFLLSKPLDIEKFKAMLI